MLMGQYIRLSWDRVSSLWFWLANCLAFKVVLYLECIVLGTHTNFTAILWLRNTLWTSPGLTTTKCVALYFMDLREYQELGNSNCCDMSHLAPILSKTNEI